MQDRTIITQDLSIADPETAAQLDAHLAFLRGDKLTPIQVAALARLGHEMAELERQERYRDHGHIYNYPDDPDLLPSVIAQRGVGMPPALLQSALFAALKPSQVPKEAARRLGESHDASAVLAAGYNGSLTLHGPVLTQTHLSVLLGLFELAQGWGPYAWLEIRPRAFARDVLKWSDTAYSKRIVIRAVLDMSTTLIFRRWGQDKEAKGLHIIREIEQADGGPLRILFDETVLHIFRGLPTFLPAAARAEFNLGLESWLHGFVLSSDCRPRCSFRKNGGFTVGWFQRLSGAPSTKSIYEFTRDLKAALRKLQGKGIIKKFEVKRGEVHLTKVVKRRP